jgi:hypothetical protein
MFTIFILFSILGILKAIYEISKKFGTSTNLNKALDEIENDPDILISRFNRNAHRETTFEVNEDQLNIYSDIQFYEYNEQGEMKILLSSTYGNIPVKAELFCLLDPNSMGCEVDFLVNNDEEKIGFIYSDSSTQEILRFLFDEYGINSEITQKGLAFEFNNIQVTTNKSHDKIEIYGNFLDGGSYLVYLDLPAFKIHLQADLESLTDIQNFPGVFIE